jgi:hypothetical protein
MLKSASAVGAGPKTPKDSEILRSALYRVLCHPHLLSACGPWKTHLTVVGLPHIVHCILRCSGYPLSSPCSKPVRRICMKSTQSVFVSDTHSCEQLCEAQVHDGQGAQLLCGIECEGEGVETMILCMSGIVGCQFNPIPPPTVTLTDRGLDRVGAMSLKSAHVRHCRGHLEGCARPHFAPLISTLPC